MKRVTEFRGFFREVLARSEQFYMQIRVERQKWYETFEPARWCVCKGLGLDKWRIYCNIFVLRERVEIKNCIVVVPMGLDLCCMYVDEFA